MFRVEVDYAPAYELGVSVVSLMVRKFHRLLDLGPDWPAKVRRQLSPELRDALKTALEEQSSLPLDLLVRQCPGDRSAGGFVRWLRGLSAGDIYELVAGYIPDGYSLPRDLAGARDRWGRILELWNQEYFGRLDPAIDATLAASAEHWAAKAKAENVDARALVEEVSGGLVLEPDADLGTVLLVPQYHASPVNMYAVYRGLLINYYPAETPPLSPDHPKPSSVRLIRALSDVQRMRTLRFLGEGPRTFTEVVRFLGQPKSTVHYHMVTLRAAGLVRVHTRMAVQSREDSGRRVAGGSERYSLRAEALRDGLASLHDYLLRKEGGNNG
ncbi:MAG: helix-turn-helix domain-containing protein [Bacillota bacterium]|nr:helix-turn-helix domain-containing protein [Bacillota bacterium]